MNTDPIALMFLSDVSVAPDLGLHYKEKLQEWIKEETNDDDIRAWFDSLGYPLANPDLLDASEEFRKMLHFWNGAYTVAFDGKYIPLVISEDRVELGSDAIIDCNFSEDKLTWSKGELHFELVMDTKYPGLVGKLVRGKLAKDEVLPKTENVYGSTIVMASPGDTVSSNLKAPHFTALDFFNGQYTVLPLKSGINLPSFLTMDLSGEIGVLGLDTLGAKIDYSNFYTWLQAGQNGKWNENALIFYHSESKYYGKVQFIVSTIKNAAGKSELVKGFFGTITTDSSQLDIPNVIGVFHSKKLPNVKKADRLEEDANKSSIAGTVLTGLGLLIAVGFFAWEQIKAKKGDKAEKTRADKLDTHIKLLETQLKEINLKTAAVSKINIEEAKKEIDKKRKENSAIEKQLEKKRVGRTAVETEIERLKGLQVAGHPLEKALSDQLDQQKEKLREITEDIIKKETKRDNTMEEIEAHHEAVKQERLREAREKFKK